jgi:hypothetical protein
VNKQLVSAMSFWAYSGPTYDNQHLKPFTFKNINQQYDNFHAGLPEVWQFPEINFGKDDFK